MSEPPSRAQIDCMTARTPPRSDVAANGWKAAERACSFGTTGTMAVGAGMFVACAAGCDRCMELTRSA